MPRPKFDYSRDYRRLDLRKRPELYRVGIGEQAVLLGEPYKSEILPHWRFATPSIARKSSREIFRLFRQYRAQGDFVGMDMARKFLQMGYTRSCRYANHRSGRKYGVGGRVLPRVEDPIKAESARTFYAVWKKVEADPVYARAKAEHRRRRG
jgi:hypothetical protein